MTWLVQSSCVGVKFSVFINKCTREWNILPPVTASLYFLLCLDNQDVTYSVEMHMQCHDHIWKAFNLSSVGDGNPLLS